MTVQALSLIELGQRMPSAEMLRTLRDEVGVDPNTILLGPPSNEAELRALTEKTMLRLLADDERELIARLVYLLHEGTERSARVKLELLELLKRVSSPTSSAVRAADHTSTYPGHDKGKPKR